MPSIPLPAPAPINQISAKAGIPQSEATGEAFGAASGQALVGLGGAIESFASSIGEYGAKQKEKADQLAATTSLASNSFAETSNNITTNYPDPTGKGLPETMQSAYLKWVDDQYANDIKSGMSPQAAQQAKISRLQQASTYTTNAANDAIRMANEHQKLSSDQAIATQVADVRVHGQTSQADIFTKEKTIYDQTEARTDLTKTQKEEIERNASNDLVVSRIQAGIEASRTSPTGVADLAALKQEISSEFYTSRIKTPGLLDQQLDQISTAQSQMIEKQNAQLSAGLQSLSERADKAHIPQEELNAVFKLHEGLGTYITPEIERKYHDIMVKQTTFVANDGNSTEALKGAKTTLQNGGPPTGDWAPTLQKFNRGSYGPATINNLNPEMGSATAQLLAKMPANLAKTVTISNGWRSTDPNVNPIRRDFMHADPRFSMHGQGKAMDIHGSPEAMAWLHANAASEGLRFPLTGVGGLPNEPWHMELASNRDQSGRILPSAYTKGTGGAGGAGRAGGGGFISDLTGFESGHANIWNTRQTTSSGPAGGYFQITTGTWSEFGGPATGYKTPVDAPYDVQAQIAAKIPINRWAPETLNKMQKAGWTIHPTMTLEENAKANGGDMTGGGSPTGGGGGGQGGGAPQGAPVAQAPGISYDTQLKIDTLNTMLATREAGIKSDPITTMAQGPNGIPITPLDGPEGYAQRAKDYGAIKVIEPGADKPFTVDEIARADNTVKSGNVGEINKLYAGIDSWPAAMREEAFKQLGQTNPFAAASARLYANNETDLANAALNGHIQLEGLTNAHTQIAWTNEANTQFAGIADALLKIDPKAIGGVKEVTDGIYASQHGFSNALNAQDYQSIAEKVMGGVLDKVNGTNTIVPPGTTGAKVEEALSSPALDWTAISVTHTPPIAQDVKSTALAEVTLPYKAMSHPMRSEDGTYVFMDDNGGLFHTMVPDASGHPVGQIYRALLNADVVNQAAAAEEETRIRTTRPSAAAAAAQAQGAQLNALGAPSSGATGEVVGRGSGAVGGAQVPPVGSVNAPNFMPPIVPPPVGMTNPTTTGTPPPPANEDSVDKLLQGHADTYADVLRRNGGNDAYVKQARDEFLQQLRDLRKADAAKSK